MSNIICVYMERVSPEADYRIESKRNSMNFHYVAIPVNNNNQHYWSHKPHEQVKDIVAATISTNPYKETNYKIRKVSHQRCSDCSR